MIIPSPTSQEALYQTLSRFSNDELLVMAKAELERRRSEERFAFFEPNGPQEKFLQLIGPGRLLVGILSAANGIGKTTLVTNILANLFYGPQSRYFDHPIFRNWPYPKRARFITDPKLVEEIGPFHSEVTNWWPRNRFKATKQGHTFYSQYKANGWVLDIMTYEQNRKEFEGGNLGLIIFDEPPPRDIWHACVTRLRMGGMILCFMTPLTEAAWFFDEVVPRHQDSVVYAAMEENCKQHGIRGQLEHDRIQQIIGEMDADEVEARAYGKAMYLKGLIYKTFEHRVHVLREPVKPQAGATVWQAVDPATSKPFAAVWGMPDADGTLYIVDEYPKEDFLKAGDNGFAKEDYKRVFKEIEYGWKVDGNRIMDRHFADVRAAANKKTLREEFGDIGLDYQASYACEEEVETGILKVREYLNYNPNKVIDALNRPKIYINPHCTNTIRSFQRWARNPKTSDPNDDRFKDHMDCVRYLVMANPRVDEPLPAPNYKRLYG
jgi:phage terminase large subunit-like protein